MNHKSVGFDPDIAGRADSLPRELAWLLLAVLLAGPVVRARLSLRPLSLVDSSLVDDDRFCSDLELGEVGSPVLPAL